ncbi:hypothetical protein ACF0H5_024184 [Mactra antiquata]
MEDIEDLISCSICMDIFDKPRVLPCQHTFCEQCLNDYVTERAKKKKNGQKRHFNLPCPLCREKVLIDDSASFGTTFPLNLTVVALCDNKEVMNKVKEKSQTFEKIQNNSEKNIEGEINVELQKIPNINNAYEEINGLEWTELGELEDETIRIHSDDVFADVILYNVLKPIITSNQPWWKVGRAILCLLISMVLYSFLVQFSIIHEIKVILTPFLFIFLKNCLREFLTNKEVIEKIRNSLYHIVIHIASTVITIFLLLCALLGACAIERFISMATSNETADGNLTMKELVYKTLEMTLQSLNNLYEFWLQISALSAVVIYDPLTQLIDNKRL